MFSTFSEGEGWFCEMSVHPFFPSVDDFVEWSGGDHAIEKILIANNGIGATKAIRSIRKWAFENFGNERAVSYELRNIILSILRLIKIFCVDQICCHGNAGRHESQCRIHSLG